MGNFGITWWNLFFWMHLFLFNYVILGLHANDQQLEEFTKDEIPNWVLQRHLDYLPLYTPVANKPSNYLYKCSSVHCSVIGDCYMTQNEKAEYKRVCECPSTHFGPKCEFNNTCEKPREVCLNGGSCQMVLHQDETGHIYPGTNCTCQEGFSGAHCEEYVKCSEPNSCGVSAKSCAVLPNGEEKCVCHNGASGEKCNIYTLELDKDCDELGCQNGTCKLSDSETAHCVCHEGYVGEKCEQSINVCSQFENLCANGGKCISDQSNGKWKCECEKGWTGKLCSEKYTPCTTHECQHLSTCFVAPNHTHICKCTAGYVGEFCEQEEKSDCRKKPCEHGGVCGLTLNGGAKCSCPPEWTGDFCEEDVDECSPDHSSEVMCMNGATCQNRLNGYHCMCMSGYVGKMCETDEDECIANHRNCLNGAKCVDAGPWKYQCLCPTAVINGKETPLFHGTHCEYRNPCINTTSLEPFCKNNGICKPTDNKFTSMECYCVNTGYTGKFCEEDVDECDLDRYDVKECVGFGGKCVNTIGSWHCNCYHRLQKGTYCSEFLDVCEHENPCKNNATCYNKYQNEPYLDYYSERLKVLFDKCQCLPGFNGTYCEKDLRCSNQECAPEEQCIEDEVTKFGKCVCRVGEKCALPVFKTCSNGIKCGERGRCINEGDSSYCECDTGFTGERCDRNVDDCVSKPCKNGGECYDGVNEYFCKCVAGFKGQNCTEDVNECEGGMFAIETADGAIVKTNRPCLNNGTCLNLFNSYACECVFGFEGVNCEFPLPDPCRFKSCPEETSTGCSSEIVNSNYKVTCQCKEGFYGDSCQYAVNPCLDTQIIFDAYRSKVKDGELRQDVCLNGGVCTPVHDKNSNDGVFSDYNCSCAVGYLGKNCEITSNECSADNCNNNGLCRVISHSYGSFQCDCFDGFTGDRCSIVKVSRMDKMTCEEYKAATGGMNPCAHSTQCIDERSLEGGSGFKCDCSKSDYSGKYCEIRNVDYCRLHKPCRYGSCTNEANSYKCQCHPGYSGTHCDQIDTEGGNNEELCGGQQKCVDYLEHCVPLPPPLKPRCLFNHAQKEEFFGHFECPVDKTLRCEQHGDSNQCYSSTLQTKCVCPHGKRGDYYCDANENLCSPELSPCDPEGTLDCVNIINEKLFANDVSCICKDGFTGQFCNETNNVCSNNPCHNAGQCFPLTGNDYRCKCHAGFGCKNCACKGVCDYPEHVCLGPGQCIGVEKNADASSSDDSYTDSVCQCADGVGGKYCKIDIRDECEPNPCADKVIKVNGDVIKNLSCVDHKGFFECVRGINTIVIPIDDPAPDDKNSTHAPYGQQYSGPDLITIIILLCGLAIVILIIIVVIKGSKGTKVVVQKTYYPTGWLELIKNVKQTIGSGVGSVYGARKRRRDEPAGQYEMGSMNEDEYYDESEYSEVDNARKKFRATAENHTAASKLSPNAQLSPPQRVLPKNPHNSAAAATASKVMAVGPDNTTPAMLALKNKDPQVRKETLLHLVNSGYDLNTQTLSRHETVVHQAILLNDLESVKILLQSASIDLTISDMNNRNALMVATATANESMFDLLCRYSCSRELLNQQQVDGSTALMAAAKFIHSNVILRRLIEVGADVAITDKKGRTALHWAAQVGNHEACILLVNAKADINAQDSEECTPLMHAVRECCVECVVKLLEMGADRTIENRDRQTALDLAELSDNFVLVQFIKQILPIMVPPEAINKKPLKKSLKASKNSKIASKKRQQQFKQEAAAVNGSSNFNTPNNHFSPPSFAPHRSPVNTVVYSNFGGNIFANPDTHTPPNRTVYSSFVSPIEPSLNTPITTGNMTNHQGFVISPNNMAQTQNLIVSAGSPSVAQPTSFQSYPVNGGTALHNGFPEVSSPVVMQPQIIQHALSVTSGSEPHNMANCGNRRLSSLSSFKSSPPLLTSNKSQFCESWSETIPSLKDSKESLFCKNNAAATTEMSQMLNPVHFTQASVYESDQNQNQYEKVDYDYSTLPKVPTNVIMNLVEQPTAAALDLPPHTTQNLVGCHPPQQQVKVQNDPMKALKVSVNYPALCNGGHNGSVDPREPYYEQNYSTQPMVMDRVRASNNGMYLDMTMGPGSSSSAAAIPPNCNSNQVNYVSSNYMPQLNYNGAGENCSSAFYDFENPIYASNTMPKMHPAMLMAATATSSGNHMPPLQMIQNPLFQNNQIIYDPVYNTHNGTGDYLFNDDTNTPTQPTIAHF